MLIFLKNKGTGPLADDKAVSVFIVSPWSQLRGVVHCTGREKYIKNTGVCRRKLLCTPCQHNILLPVTYVLESITYGHTARCTGCVCSYKAPGKTVEDADVCGAGLRHHAYVGGGAYLVGGVCDKHGIEIKERVYASCRRAIGNPTPTCCKLFAICQSCILKGVVGTGYCHKGNAPHPPYLFPGEVGRGEIYRTSQTGIHSLVLLPLRHILDFIFLLLKTCKDFRPFIPQGRYTAAACNYNSSVHRIPPLTEIT